MKDELLRNRYTAMYGENEGEARYEEDLKKRRSGYTAVVLVFILALTASVLKDGAPGTGVKESGGKLVEITRPEKGSGPVSLDMEIKAEDGKASSSKKKTVTIDPEGETKAEEDGGAAGEESAEERLGRRIDSAVRTLNSDTGSPKVILPEELEDGTRLSWRLVEKNDMPLIAGGMLFILYAMYMSRYSRVKKEETEARESVIRDLPGFMNKMVLLVRGGLVLEEAFERAVDDAALSGAGEDSYFYGQLAAVRENVRKSNSPMSAELEKFARRSGVRELMRFSNMISDNIKKGTDITEKMLRESGMLWFERRKNSEERGRIAETRLTLPLMILIMVLIVISVAPALLSM